MTPRNLLIALLLLAAASMQAADYSKYYKELPTPVKAVEAVVIPQHEASITDFGAVGDGIWVCTEAFKKAISQLTKQGGGRLNVPEGVWLTGPIQLKDNIELHLDKNAIIYFSPDKRLYLKDDNQTTGRAYPCIRASKAKNIAITGAGIIDGGGQRWRPVKRGKVSDVEWAAFRRMGGTVTDDGSLWYPFGLKSYPDIADDPLAQEKMRTHLVRFTDCQRVLVRGVTIQNAPKFHLVPQRCSDVVIDGVTVRCPWNAQNGDGIDLMQCSRVLVIRCLVDVGDDGICLKGGAGEEGLKHGPCQDILVADNVVCHAHGGFVIGSEFSGGMYRIAVLRNTFTGTDTGLRFKSAPGRGGKCGDILISDIYMSDIQGEAVVFETSYADRPVGRDGAVAPKVQEFVPEFCDIRISRVTCRGARTAVAATGTPEMIHDITLSDCVFFYSENATLIDDPAMVRLERVRFETFAND